MAQHSRPEEAPAPCASPGLSTATGPAAARDRGAATDSGKKGPLLEAVPWEQASAATLKAGDAVYGLLVFPYCC